MVKVEFRTIRLTVAAKIEEEAAQCIYFALAAFLHSALFSA